MRHRAIEDAPPPPRQQSCTLERTCLIRSLTKLYVQSDDHGRCCFRLYLIILYVPASGEGVRHAWFPSCQGRRETLHLLGKQSEKLEIVYKVIVIRSN